MLIVPDSYILWGHLDNHMNYQLWTVINWESSTLKRAHPSIRRDGSCFGHHACNASHSKLAVVYKVITCWGSSARLAAVLCHGRQENL